MLLFILPGISSYSYWETQKYPLSLLAEEAPPGPGRLRRHELYECPDKEGSQLPKTVPWLTRLSNLIPRLPFRRSIFKRPYMWLCHSHHRRTQASPWYTFLVSHSLSHYPCTPLATIWSNEARLDPRYTCLEVSQTTASSLARLTSNSYRAILGFTVDMHGVSSWWSTRGVKKVTLLQAVATQLLFLFL